MTSSAETWKDIPGYEGRYQASDQGRVRSVDRFVRCGRNGAGIRLLKGRVLRPAANRYNPHLYVVLGHGAAGSPVHRLVAQTFLGPQAPGQDVRHLDGDAKNNRVSNLAYGTRTENIIDVYRIGRPWRVLTAAQAREIRERLRAGERGSVLAKEYGVSQSCISAIKQRRTYKWMA